MKMNIAQKTDVGRQRQDNQDNMSWLSLGGGELFIVADGMGGEVGGRTAADMAIAAIKESFEKGGLPVIQLLKTSIEEANRRIHAKGTSGDLKFHKMGTTVVVLFIKDDKAYIAHIGDSRIYRYRMGRLERLTKDHSQVQQLVDMGIIKPEEAEDHPDANVITRSLGSKPVVEVDIRPEPETILPGDKFLLCTDGLSSLVADREIQAILAEERPVHETCDLLIQTALNKGGHDNVTVQLISFDGQSRQELPAKKSPKPDRFSFNRSKLIVIGVAVVVFIALLLFLTLLKKEPVKKQASEQPKKLEVIRPEIESTKPEPEPKDNQTTAKPASDKFKTWTIKVVEGDTIKKIAQLHKVDPQFILQINNLKDDFDIDGDLKKAGINYITVPKKVRQQ